MADGGEVRIVTERVEGGPAASDAPQPGLYARVRIEDDGQGMSEDVLRRVFDPFFTTKGEMGTGIGLSQVQAFMRRVGGQVHIASEGGVGTTVDLLFPSIRPEA
jgi:signal transduction histidine kinase